jgi:hypothetical protein
MYNKDKLIKVLSSLISAGPVIDIKTGKNISPTSREDTFAVRGIGSDGKEFKTPWKPLKHMKLIDEAWSKFQEKFVSPEDRWELDLSVEHLYSDTKGQHDLALISHPEFSDKIFFSVRILSYDLVGLRLIINKFKHHL